ncbi:porphobilinogen deaminase [Platysternon megacephalum]|uniref:Porphobilinogen deaminase n=1 Tax=Platysternon megacephalum TaxID=55544 RepID=A0A4D9DDC1_9SAUR|nr:porphobilinogen deaminase [Platysternon megacephalum]
MSSVLEYMGMCSVLDQIHSNLLNRTEQECLGLQEKLQYLTAQNKGLQTQLSETKRKHAESECKSKEEVMAVRLREADSMAAVAEMRQRIAELEIQREEGMIQGELNNSDSSQYIRELKDQIDELKAEVSAVPTPSAVSIMGAGSDLSGSPLARVLPGHLGPLCPSLDLGVNSSVLLAGSLKPLSEWGMPDPASFQLIPPQHGG